MDFEYRVTRVLGTGAFGEVLEVKSSATGTKYAIKLAKMMNRESLIKEIQLHSRLVHPNIVQFVSSFESMDCKDRVSIVPLPSGVAGNCHAMVIEHCQYGTLGERISSSPVPVMAQIKSWGGQIASALLYLKEQGIVHRDLKPDNLLFCGEDLKLGDFGLAEMIEVLDGRRAIGQGTPFFMPYEAFAGQQSYYSDIFAFGVVLYMCYTGRRPFNAKDKVQLMKALKADKVQFQFAPTFVKDRDPVFEALLLDMLSSDWVIRPTIEDIIAHPLFKVEELDDTISVEEDDDMMETFRRQKLDFGEGTREQFYLYLANLNPYASPLPYEEFTKMWDKL